MKFYDFVLRFLVSMEVYCFYFKKIPKSKIFRFDKKIGTCYIYSAMKRKSSDYLHISESETVGTRLCEIVERTPRSRLPKEIIFSRLIRKQTVIILSLSLVERKRLSSRDNELRWHHEFPYSSLL